MKGGLGQRDARAFLHALSASAATGLTGASIGLPVGGLVIGALSSRIVAPYVVAGFLGAGGAFAGFPSASDSVDSGPPLGAIPVMLSRLEAFDGVNFPRLRMASSANLASAVPAQGNMSLMVHAPGDSSLAAAPGVAVQASVTRAAVVGVRHVCTSITASTDAGAAAGGTGGMLVVLRDGLTGVGAVLWNCLLQAPANDSKSIALSGLSIIGTLGNAMTLEFVAAPGAGVSQTVTLVTHDAT